MSTQTLNSLEITSEKPAQSGLIATIKAFIGAIGDGARAADTYRHLTRNGVSHQDAVRKILVEDYKRG